MVEDSSILFSQSKPPTTSLDSDGCTVLPHGLSQARAQVKNKPRFAEFMCSYAEIFRFVVVVTEAVIPMTLWGSKRNFNLIANRQFDHRCPPNLPPNRFRRRREDLHRDAQI